MRLLARREHARAELKQKLSQRGFDSALVESTLDEFADENLQSDERYADALLRSCVGRGYGPVYILNRAGQYGIRHIDGLNEFDWNELAITARQKKFGLSVPESINDRHKQQQFLKRRGFTADAIESAMSATQC